MIVGVLILDWGSNDFIMIYVISFVCNKYQTIVVHYMNQLIRTFNLRCNAFTTVIWEGGACCWIFQTSELDITIFFGMTIIWSGQCW